MLIYTILGNCRCRGIEPVVHITDVFRHLLSIANLEAETGHRKIGEKANSIHSSTQAYAPSARISS